MKSRWIRWAAAGVLLLGSVGSLQAQGKVESEITAADAAASDQWAVVESTQIERLEGLSRLWGYVKYFHPALAYRTDIDWDASLLAAVPRVMDASDDAEYARALERMLATLGDPSTRIEAEVDPGSVAHVSRSASCWLTDDGVLVIQVGDYYALAETDAQAVLAKARDALSGARAVVLDLRSPGPTDSFAKFQLTAYVGPLEREIIDRILLTPGERRRVYYGLPNFQAFASGQYRSGLLTGSGKSVMPASNGRAISSVLLLNRHAAVLEGTVASQVAGWARIVFEGDLADLPHRGSETIDLPGGVRARVRMSESIFPDGTDGSLHPDTAVAPAAPDGPDRALDLAIALASKFEPSAHNPQTLPATARVGPDSIYRDMTYPNTGYRFLALARLWNAIEYFYPYRHLLDKPWDAVQREFVPRFLAARTATDYALAIAEMSTRLYDSHAYVAGPVFNTEVLGSGYPPIRVRLVENTLVVTGIRHPALAGEASIGDVVVSVDGENAESRLERYARIISASTHANLIDKASLQYMNGPAGSDVQITLREAGGREKTVMLERRFEDFTTLYHHERSGEVVRVLEGNIGYVDLDRLQLAEVDDMFEQLSATEAIIFDMRGYPNGTAWAIAPRLADAERTVALFSTPIRGHRSPQVAAETFRQVVTPSPDEETRYKGRTVMLIDERSQSQAEHTGLYLRAANGTLFIGSRTAGANGEITSVTLPGGITVGFTGQSVRHPDGRELQRVGLIPDIEITPTLAGIREGRDEVLELAVEYLLGY